MSGAGDLAVQYQKLPEWLLARRIVPEGYARLLLGIDAKISEALAIDVSDDAARALVEEHREAMTYFAARDIYEAIAKTPAGQAKTLLGAHTDPAASKWRAVVDAYRKRNLNWMSGARLLIQNVSYELPALNKHAATCERQVADCTQRQAELTRSEANARARYEALLGELGIKGFDPARELRAHAAEELPRIHAQLAELLQSSGAELADYYEAFSAHVAGANGTAGSLPLVRAVASGGVDVRAEDVARDVPALRALREEAARNASSHGGDADGAGDAVEPAREIADTPAMDASGGGIDWGGLAGVGGASGEGGDINWDFGVAAGAGGTGDAGGAAGGIDWGIELEASSGADAAAEPATGGVADGGIDWGAISFEGLAVDAEGDEQKAVASVAEPVEEGERLLEDPPCREMLYQELAEVDAFLEARVAELEADGNTADSNLPEAVQKPLVEVKRLQGEAARAGDLLTGKATQRLLLLRSSKRYLDQHLKRIEIAKAQCSKPVAQRAALEKQKGEQAEEAKGTRKEAARLLEATRKVQKEMEDELSAHFKAAVRIVGDINQL